MLKITYQIEGLGEISENLKVENRQDVAAILGEEIAKNSTADACIPDIAILLVCVVVGCFFGYVGFFFGVAVGLWACKDYDDYNKLRIEIYNDSTI